MSDEHPFLQARHVDDLTAAVKNLTATLIRIEEREAKADTATLLALQAIASNTANLPALMDVLMGQKTNGDIHNVADRTDP